MPSSSIRTPIQVLALMYFIGLLLPGKQSFLLGLKTSHVAFSTRAWAIRRVGGCRSLSSSASSNEDTTTATTTTTAIPPWNHPTVSERVKSKRKNNRLRFRQHVNPLARRYQQATQLPLDWPSSVFHNHPQRPLFLDIGSAKGRFLMDACARDTRGQYNYLGLEIRPGIAELARQRIPQHHPDLVGRIDFIGCNANVDLHRLLQLYHQHTTTTATSSSSLQLLQTVTIQFPDPHFKASHAKRRVVTKSLIATIAKYMPPSGIVFLQSDVQCKSLNCFFFPLLLLMLLLLEL